MMNFVKLDSSIEVQLAVAMRSITIQMVAVFKLEQMEKLSEQVLKYKTQTLICRGTVRVLDLMVNQLQRITLGRL